MYLNYLRKYLDDIYLNNALFMYDYKNGNLPDNFNDFSSISARHNYETRLATKNTLSIPQVRTNYGKFNIRFIGPKMWNLVDELLKQCSRLCIKNEQKIINEYKE